MLSVTEAVQSELDAVRVALPNNRMVRGVLLEDFSFGGSSTWDNGGGVLAAANAINQLAVSGKAIFDAYTDGNSDTIGLNSQRAKDRIAPRFLTTSSWGGSTRPTFSVAMGFYCLNKNDDVVSTSKQLYELVMPVAIDAIHEVAPMGYTLAIDGTVKSGTTSISIGNWFRATGLVCSSVDIAYSKQLNKQKKPLFAVATCSFTPAQTITAAQMQAYLL